MPINIAALDALVDDKQETTPRKGGINLEALDALVDDSQSDEMDLKALEMQYEDFLSENKEFVDDYRNRHDKTGDYSGVVKNTAASNPIPFLGIKLLGRFMKSDEEKASDELEKNKYSELIKMDEEYRKKIDSHPATLNMRKMMLSSLEDSLNETEGMIKEKKDALPSDVEVMKGMAAGNDIPLQYDKDIDNLDNARKMYSDAIDILNAPSKYDNSNGFVNFMKGSGDTFNDRDFWTFGLTKIARNIDLSEIADKLGSNEKGEDIDKILTTGEQKMLDAFTKLGAAQAERAHDLSLGYQAGQSSAESVKFMAEFLLTKGAAKAASSAAKSALSKWLIRHTAKDGLMRGLGKGAVWGTEAALSTVARTPLMPSTYVNITDRFVGFDDKGNVVSKPMTEALVDGVTDSVIENVSEMSGAHIAGTLGLAGKQAMRLVPNKAAESVKYFFKKMGNSKLGDMWKSMNNPKVVNFLKDTGYNGIGEEMLEEWYGNALRSVTNDPNALKEFATWDNQLMTFFSFLPMALGGAAVSALSGRNAQGRYEESVSALEKVLREMGKDDEGVRSFMSSLDEYGNGGEAELRGMMNDLAGDKESKEKLFKATADYLYNRSKSKVTNDILQNKDGESGGAQDESGGGAGVEGDDYAGTVRLKDGLEVTLQRTSKGMVGWLDDGNVLKVTDDMIAEYLPEESVRESEKNEDVPEERNDKMYLNDKEVGRIEMLDEGLVRVTDVDGYSVVVDEKEVEGYDENGNRVDGGSGVSVNLVEDEEGNVERVDIRDDEEGNVQSKVPTTEDGKPDYDSMSLEMFAEEFEKEFGAEAARGELERMSADIDERIEKLRKETPTNMNERAENMREIAGLEGKQKRVHAALERYDKNENPKDIKPIGKGFFGNIYDQFRGQTKEAVNFLLRHKDGDLLGVFHREELGDIDLIWGDKSKNQGLDHIIDKHVNQLHDFATPEDAASKIDDVINNGTLTKDKWDKATFEKDGYRVIVSKNVRDGNGKIVDENKNWVVTAFDNTKSQKEKSSSAPTRVTPDNTYGSRAVTSNEVSDVKDTEDFSEKQEKGKVNKRNSKAKVKSDVGSVDAEKMEEAYEKIDEIFEYINDKYGKSFDTNSFLREIETKNQRSAYQYVKKISKDYLGGTSLTKYVHEYLKGKGREGLFRETQENDDVRFREVDDKDGGKSLVGIHNISDEKLMKALRQGGLANPSSAVIDVDKQSHTGYGSISLVMPSSMVDKRTGRNAGTFEGDAWTPTYPQVEKQFSEDGSKRASEDISSVPEDMRSIVRQGIDSFMDGRDASGLAYLFLHERGEAPETVMIENKYGDKTRDAIIEATKGGFSLVNLGKDAKDKIVDVYIDENFNGDRKAYEEYLQKRIDILKNNLNHERSLVRKRSQEDLDAIEEYGFDYGAISNFVRSVGDDVRNGGKADSQRTMLEAIKQMEERGLEREFAEWKDGLNDRYHVEEVIFDGFTPTGNRRYVKNTLENVSKLMKKQGRAGATGFTAGFSRFAASLMKAKGSLKDIRKSKNKLTTEHADVDAFRDKWSEVFFDLGSKLQPDAKGYDDYGLARLQEAATKSNPKKYIKDEYGIDFSDEDVKRLNDMVDAILNEYPAMYFETKFERPVYLNEFAAAIVPDNINANVRGALMNAGLQIFDYKEGDEQSRQAAVQEASNIEGVRFRREASMDTSVDEVNRRFNDELEQQINGELPNGHIYQLGKPSDRLLSTGFPNMPIELSSSNLADHAKKKRHPFDLKDVKGIVNALQNPIAIFSYGDKGKSQNAIVEIQKDGKNFLVGVHFNQNRNGVEVSSIRGIFPKDNAEWLNWISQDKGLYLDKEKIQTLINQQRMTLADVKYLDLDSVTKVMKKHKNPTLEEGKIVSAVESLSEDLNVPVRIVRNVDEIKDKDSDMQGRKRGSKGWYDPKTGEVVVVLPNATDVRDAQATMLHEIVGHKGIRGLFGDKLGEFTKRVLDSMPEAERKKWVDRYNGNEQLAAEEYVAQFAEGYENPTMWEKIVAIVRELLRDLGIDLKLSDADLKYTLWRGVRRMKDGSYSGDFTQSERSLFREGEKAISDGSVKKIANLMNNLKNQKASVKLTSRLLARYVRGTFDADMIGFMGKRQFDSILKKIDEGVGGHFENISKGAGELLNERRKLAGESIRESDAERRKELNKQVKELDRQIEDVVRGELDSIFKQLADVAVRVELKREKSRFDKLTHLKVEGKNQSGVSVAKKVDEDTKLLIRFIQNHIGEDMTTVIQELSDKESSGKMSRIDEIKMRGALVLQKYFESDNSAAFIDEYNKQKREISGEISELKDKINEEKGKNLPDKGELSRLRKKLKSKQQELKATEEILFENRASYLDRLRELNDDLKGFIETGRGKFMEWVNEEIERKRTIFDEAMRDMDTRNAKEKADPLAEEKRTFWKKTKDFTVRYLLAPLHNLDYIVTHYSSNAMRGEGEFYDRIFKGEDGLFEAYTKQWTGLEKIRNKIDDKVKEIFGKNHDYLSLMRKSDKQMKDVTVTYFNEEKKYEYKMTPTYGNALYLVMVDKMTDAAQKLRAIGITEEEVEKLRNALPDNYIKFAEWIQGELLPGLREKYNETHLRLFGSSMADIQNYFPLKIQEGSKQKNVDLNKTFDDALPSAVTGNIINRKPSDARIDIKGTNAFEVLLEYAKDMEHWNAFARVNKDLSTLLSNKAFRNMLRNKNKHLPEMFKTAAQIAVESYRPNESFMSEFSSTVTKGFTAAKISFRFFTAWKQILSAPAFWAYATELAYRRRLIKYMLPHNFASNWKWAMENLPLLEKRWKGRMMGNEKLDSVDWATKLQNTKFLKSGMLPNAFVDALTCASGARAVYEYRLEKYNKLGIPKEEALRRARIDAEIAYNQTQQSSEGAMVGAMQKSRNMFNQSITVFNNSGIAYQRQLFKGIEELFRNRDKEIESEMRKLLKMGVSNEKARKVAEREIKLANREARAKIRMFGVVINGIYWAFGSNSYSFINSLWTSIFGDDDKEKEEANNVLIDILKNIGKASAFSPIQGLPGGKWLSEIAGGYNSSFGETPGYHDIANGLKLLWDSTIGDREFDVFVAYEVLRTIGMGMTGADLNTAANMYLAIDDLIKTDGESWIEDLGLFMNVPQSQIKTVAMKKREGETYVEYEKRIRDLYVAYRYLDKNMSPWLRSELKNRYNRTPEERETRKEINKERNKRDREKAKEKERRRYQ